MYTLSKGNPDRPVPKEKRYFIGDVRDHKSVFPLAEGLTEDGVWRKEYSFVFEGLPENIADMCHCGFTEMVNNVNP
ncbi:MAG: hypothetical protein WCG19_02880 [Chlorobiaceae bacterium]